jgi:Zn-dependent protease
MRENEPWGVGDWAKTLIWAIGLAIYGHIVLLVADRDLLRAGLARDIGPFPNVRDFLLSLVVVFGWEHVGVLLHELGHALMAWTTGEGVQAIDIGRGRQRWHGHVHAGSKRSCLIWRPYPGSGRTLVRRRVRGRSPWVFAAGPMADLLALLLIGLPVLATLRGSRPAGPSWGLELMAMIAINEGSQFLTNAIPKRRDDGFNDGAKVLWRAGRQSVFLAGPSPTDLWHDAVRRSNAGDPSAAVQMAQEMVARVEGGSKAQAQARLVLAVHLARGGRFVEAVEQVTGLAPDGRLKQGLLDTVVADLLLSDAVVNGTALERAQLAELATVIDPDEEPAARHTYALWLLASGQAAAAAAEAQRALREAENLDAAARAAVCATVVIALAVVGDRSQARSWYDEVPQWSPWRRAAARSLGL